MSINNSIDSLRQQIEQLNRAIYALHFGIKPILKKPKDEYILNAPTLSTPEARMAHVGYSDTRNAIEEAIVTLSRMSVDISAIINRIDLEGK